ncbi:MAG: PP2C family protein-serine/threonine phosphatase [Planctomycetota bacterium]|jgi:serine phosphatase RsbU (regulator of sigma subunit)
MAKVGRHLLKKFAAMLEASPSFRVVLDDGRTWLCPFCGAPAVEDQNAPDFVESALKHILDQCPKANGLEGAVIPEGQLKDVVVFHRLKAKYASEPAWRLRVGSGAWLCPFCVQPTNARMVDDAGAQRPADDIVRDIRAHLARCYPYSEHPDIWQSVEDIRAVLGERKRQEQETKAVTEHMKVDPVYGFDDGEGHWICPFCEKAIMSVDFSTPLAKTHSAPGQVLAHFKSGKCTYQGGVLDTGKTLEEMQEAVGRITGAEEPETEGEGAADLGPTGYLESLKGELDELRSHLGQSKKLQADLERARKAQRRMLPSRPPDIPGYELDVYFRACEQVSGDFYDFISLPDGSVGIVMGDISGHGVDAGIVMGMAKKVFSLRAQSGADPVTVAAQVNSDICPELETATFISAVYGVLNPQEHVFRFVRCGHTFPVLYRRETGGVEEVASDGVVLGSLKDPMFTDKTQLKEIALAPGDCVAFFTDGITEAMTEDAEEFGADLTKEAIARHGPTTARGVVEGLIGAIQVFTGGHPQADDESLIVVRRQA